MSRPDRKVTLLYDVVEDEEQEKAADEPVYRQVARALSERGHEVQTLTATSDVPQLSASLARDESDIVFNLCESLGGVDAAASGVAGLLELLGKPFTGAGSLGLSLAQDKALAKKLFAFHGLSSPKFSVMRAGQVDWSDELQFPLFVKPSASDSSEGIDAGALVHNVKELMERISYIHTSLKSGVLIEEFIDGRELFIAVLGGDDMTALPIIEWDFSKVKGPKFATAEAKWNKGSEGYKAPERFPTDIPEPVYQAIQSAAVDACRALHIYDYARIDMRLRRRKGPGQRADNPRSWEFYIIEANPNPYLERHSEVAMAAKECGMDYGSLLDRILDSAARRALRQA
jgi:D-alanine-D-alanine ligase